jgi:DNA-directed RNA polymerase subunit RPC12/RpoP
LNRRKRLAVIQKHIHPKLWFETDPGVFDTTPPPCVNCGAQSLTGFWEEDGWYDRRWLVCDYCGSKVGGKVTSLLGLLHNDEPIVIRADGVVSFR